MRDLSPATIASRTSRVARLSYSTKVAHSTTIEGSMLWLPILLSQVISRSAFAHSLESNDKPTYNDVAQGVASIEPAGHSATIYTIIAPIRFPHKARTAIVPYSCMNRLAYNICHSGRDLAGNSQTGA